MSVHCVCGHGRFLHREGRCMLESCDGCVSFHPDDGEDHDGPLHVPFTHYEGRYKGGYSV